MPHFIQNLSKIAAFAAIMAQKHLKTAQKRLFSANAAYLAIFHIFAELSTGMTTLVSICLN